jgi:hypothetical protein
MGEEARFSPEPVPPAPTLGELLEKLNGLMSAVEDNPRGMDASLADAHDFVEGIWRAVFGKQGTLDPVEYKDNYEALKKDREAENDMYEVFSYDLERYSKRQAKNLSLSESDSDRETLVTRRRVYIARLAAFHAQASSIAKYTGGSTKA